MVCRNSQCLGKYDFERVSSFAIQRFVEGYNTVDLLIKVKTAQEVEEVCLVCRLDVEENKIKDLQLSCFHSLECKVKTCREQLQTTIEYQLKCKNINENFKMVL